MQNLKFIAFLVVLIAIGITLGFVFSFSNNVNLQYSLPHTNSENSSNKNIIQISGEANIEPNIVEVISEDNIETTTIPENIKAVYLTGWSAGTESKRRTTIENLLKYNFNAVVIDIKDEAGHVSYNSSVQTAIDISSSKKMISNIEATLKDFKDAGIYVIGRIVTFKDPLYAKKVSENAYKKSDGSLWVDYAGNNWPNPYNEASWEYPIALAKEAATLGFDEIQFDYIRFPSSEGKTKNIAFGFESDTKSKSQIINSFLEKIMLEMKEYNVVISADVFGITTKKAGDFERIGQDFYAISNIVDVVCPMVYPSHYGYGEYGVSKPDTQPYKIIHGALKDALKQYELQSGDSKVATIRPYLQDFTATWLKKGNYINYNTKAVIDQIQACYDLGIYDFTLWDPSNKYAYEALDSVIITVSGDILESGDILDSGDTLE